MENFEHYNRMDVVWTQPQVEKWHCLLTSRKCKLLSNKLKAKTLLEDGQFILNTYTISSLHMLSLYHIKICESYVVTLLDWKPTFEWYIARFLINNGHQNDTCYHEINLSLSLSLSLIMSLIHNKFGRTCVIS